MKYIITILSAVLLFSCSVKKRTYRDGYYVDWTFQKKNAAVKKSVLAETVPAKSEGTFEIVTVGAQKTLEVPELMSDHIRLPGDTCGDVITFRSGDQVTARVTEITDDKIKYKRCDNVEGPVFVVNKSTVASIKYTNGVVEKIEAPLEPVYTPNTNSKPNDKFYGPQKVHPLAVLSLISLLVGSWVIGLGIIAALIMSIIAIKEINKNPKKWKGILLAKIVRSISLVLLILFGVAILIILGTI
jgi:hypothetical protein